MSLRLPGQYLDSETGLYHNWFRDYDASVGRYIESDPIGLNGGINTYLYAKANSLRFVDKRGQLFIDPKGQFPDDTTGPSRPPCNCPTPPEQPGSCPLDSNISEAEDHINPEWFYDQVKNHGPWDYKQQGPQYQDFGNFNYGATGAAMGFPDFILKERLVGHSTKQ